MENSLVTRIEWKFRLVEIANASCAIFEKSVSE